MKVSPTSIPDVLLIEPEVFKDDRGLFKEVYQHNRYIADGIEEKFVQDNFSRSRSGTLRGLHYQIYEPQGKLVQVLHGEIFDVAVDLRKGSDTFGKHVGVLLSGTNHLQLYIPQGFAHGFYAISDAEVFYKCTNYRYAEYEQTLLWSDPDIGIDWDLHDEPLLSEKDEEGMLLKDVVIPLTHVT